MQWKHRWIVAAYDCERNWHGISAPVMGILFGLFLATWQLASRADELLDASRDHATGFAKLGVNDSEPPGARQVLEQLESDLFIERQQGMTLLRRLGAAGTPLLKRLAEHGEAESRTRALQLLDEYYRNESGDREDLRDVALQALQELAAGEGTAARRAQRILQPPSAAPPGGDANLLMRRMQLQMLQQGQGFPAPAALPPRPGAPPPQPHAARPNGQPAGPQARPGVRRRVTAQRNGQRIEITEDDKERLPK
jgi:hypothetical protein